MKVKHFLTDRCLCDKILEQEKHAAKMNGKMAKSINQRVTADMQGDFVVFLIGMRINKPWKFWRWIPVAAAMPKMLSELARHPELGLMHARTHFGLRNILVVQYWRSFEQLHRYATAKDAEHLPAWRRFNQQIGSGGDVGIWHETYLIPDGGYECVYSNMPPYGLAKASNLKAATGARASARGRLRQTDGSDLTIEP